jgi:thiol-disulfide isomerase/thioredoxin
MTQKSRASRRDAARQRERQQTSTKWLLPVAGLVIAGVAVVAIVLSQAGSGAGASASPTFVAPTAPTITGTALPRFEQTIGDAAKGQPAPVVQGHDYQGNAVSITPTGKPTVVLFAAHWCPHCEREVPLVKAWIDAGKAPADVDFVLVSTAADPSAPNYPPEEWLQAVAWPAPVVADPTNTVQEAYGVSGYPFFVILDGDGNVVARLSGEIPINDLDSLLAAVPRS